jgi:uncharacterized UBP type Zn finger protein
VLSSPEEFYDSISLRKWHTEADFPAGQQADSFSFFQHLCHDVSDLKRLFQLELISTVTCGNCNKATVTQESSIGLSLPIPSSPKRLSKQLSVQMLFNLFCEAESILDFSCDQCIGPQQASRTYCVKTWPQVLLVRLQRYSPCARKVTRPIDILGGISEFPSPSTVDYVIHHEGASLTSGHYWAAWRWSSDRLALPFWRLDDQKPNPKKPQAQRIHAHDALNSSTAYTVVYGVL